MAIISFMLITPPLDLNALQTFVVFCEAGSMTLAANRLRVSQSAVSQGVKRLEFSMGCALVDRDARPAQLTHAGRTLLTLARDLLAHANSMAEQVRQGGLSGHPRIRLGCVDSFAATVGPTLVRAISSDTSELHLGSGLTPDLLTRLLGRELDLAICTDAATSQPRLMQTSLFTECFVLVLPLAHAGALQPALAELPAQLPLIRYSLRSLIGQQVERYLHHMGIAAERRFEFDATDPLLSLVAAGLGWAISTPLCVWQSRHFVGQVAVFPLDRTALGQREFFLLQHRGEWPQLAEDMARVTRQVVRHSLLPEMRAALPTLPDQAFVFP